MFDTKKEGKNERNRKNIMEITAILAFALFGVLLFIAPTMLDQLAFWGLIVLMGVYAVWNLVKYFASPAHHAMNEYSFAFALIALFCIALMLLKRTLILTLLPNVWGLSLIAAGFIKGQIALDFKRVKLGKWWWPLACATVSVVLGTLGVWTPAFLNSIFTQFLAGSLIVEALMDAFIFFTTKKAENELEERLYNPLQMNQPPVSE